MRFQFQSLQQLAGTGELVIVLPEHFGVLHHVLVWGFLEFENLDSPKVLILCCLNELQSVQQRLFAFARSADSHLGR